MLYVFFYTKVTQTNAFLQFFKTAKQALRFEQRKPDTKQYSFF